MTVTTYHKALNWAFLYLKQHGMTDESIPKTLLMTRQKWSYTQLVLNYQTVIPNQVLKQLKADLLDIVDGQPLQYVLGETVFFGLPLKVTSDTLIPRFETEELVDWILQTFQQETCLRVLDVGTGSGAIAIALAKQRPNWQVCVTDVSKAALEIAKDNAISNEVVLDYYQGDFLEPLNGQQFDIIVSNPPYIAESERAVMDKSVYEYEPNLALFAKEDGLYFYRRFSQEINPYLKSNGHLFMEFGYQQKEAIQKLFEQNNPKMALTFKNDLAGWPRMMLAKINN